MGSSIWKHTIAMLEPTPTPPPRLVPASVVSAPTVRVLEVTSALTITVSWGDAQGGHYGSQIWRLRRAPFRGRCALTGRPIQIGDSIYRPLLGDMPPLNADAMISATSITNWQAMHPCIDEI